ncbi:hypothetical protein [Bacteriophage sp.]|nr:hypothetical protein [Bacteriophage sp.]
MNASELADEFNVENNDWNEDNLRHWGKQAATLLRQQQAELDEWEAAPLIVMIRQLEAEIEALKAKTLTDEEILEVIKKFDKDGKSHYFSEGMGFFEIKEFAEAILRKAQEK